MQIKGILSRSAASSVARIVTVGCILVANGVVFRVASKEEAGFWTMLLSLMFLASGFDLGFRFSMSNRLAALSASGKVGEEERRETFMSAFYFVLVLAAALFGVFMLAGCWVRWETLFNISDPELLARARRIIPVVAALLLAFLPFSMCGGIYNAYDEIELGSVAICLQGILSTGTLVAAARTHSFEAMLFGYFGAYVGSGIVMTIFFMARRGWSFLPPRWSAAAGIVSSLFPRSVEFFFFSMCSAVALVVGTLVTGHTSGAAAAGDFSVMQRIFSVLTTVHLAFLSAVGPLVTRHAHADDWGNVRDRLGSCLRRIWPPVFPLAGGLLLAVHPFLLRVWLGHWLTDYWLAGLFLAWACSVGFVNTYSVFLNSLGLIRVQAALSYAMVLPTLLLPAYLGARLGSHGVALASLLCMLPALFVYPLYTRSALKHKLIKV